MSSKVAGATRALCLIISLCAIETAAAQSARDPGGVFAQFDIGVSADERVTWTPLAQSGVDLRPRLVVGGPNDTLATLMRTQNIRIDRQSLELIQILNPDVAGVDAPLNGQNVTAIVRTGPLLNAAAIISLELHHTDAERLRASIEALRASIRELQARAPVRAAPFENRFVELASVYRPDAITSLTQIRAATNAVQLSEYRVGVVAADPDLWSERRQALRQIDATTVLVRDVAAPAPPNNDGRANLNVSLAYNGAIAAADAGRCRLAWAVNGLEDLRATYEDLPPIPRNIRLYPSPVRVWVVRAGQVISEETPVITQQQLRAANPAITINLREPCRS